MVFMKKNNSKKLKLFLLSVIVITLTVVIVVFINYRRILIKPEKLISSLPEGANLSIGEIHQTATRNGIKEWSLDAASARYINAKKMVVLDDLSITFFLKDDREVYLTANKGILKTDSKDIEITGNVIVKNENSRLFTEKIQYKHGRRMLLSKVPVKITGSSYQLTADMLSFDLNTNKTVLKGRVDGSFSENFTL